MSDCRLSCNSKTKAAESGLQNACPPTSKKETQHFIKKGSPL